MDWGGMRTGTGCFVLVTLVAGSATAAQGQGRGGIQLRKGDFLEAPVPDSTAAMKQSPAIKRCDPALFALGYANGSGVVSYLIGADGKADTGTIQVQSHEGLSANGLSSIARRVLAACEFVPARDAQNPVGSRVSSRFQLRSALDHPLPQPALGGTMCSDSGGKSHCWFYANSVERDDEIPAMIRCPKAKAGLQGSVELGFVVDTMGKADPNTIELPDGARPVLEAAMKAALACSYAPGRNDGAPIRVLIRQRFDLK